MVSVADNHQPSPINRRDPSPPIKPSDSGCRGKVAATTHRVTRNHRARHITLDHTTPPGLRAGTDGATPPHTGLQPSHRYSDEWTNQPRPQPRAIAPRRCAKTPFKPRPPINETTGGRHSNAPSSRPPRPSREQPGALARCEAHHRMTAHRSYLIGFRCPDGMVTN